MPCTFVTLDIPEAFDPMLLDPLPTYEEAQGYPPLAPAPHGWLPSFKTIRSARYHPYRRPSLRMHDGTYRYSSSLVGTGGHPLDTPARHPDFEDRRFLAPQERIGAMEFAHRVQRLNTAFVTRPDGCVRRNSSTLDEHRRR
ncbi:hypothetical protein CPB83DRAFT_830721 [Crepidotus variabilis]|uniref:Uncharacterized protein n=1 Tax=Crepidotus variabilis TaxID=179855 RepID=A0A9P6JX87_9AGAR|nr:hypothetical protein CPB83DRAFT_830721 [Crepidotus variabilis]